MFYTVVGKPRRLKKQELDLAMQVAVNYLKIDDVDTEVEVQFADKLDGNAQGYATWEDDDVYVIEISKSKDLSTEDIIQTIMHEMVHVAQYIRGDYVPGEGRKLNRWKGKPVDLPYSKQPWERQAYRLEKVMYKRYCEAQ